MNASPTTRRAVAEIDFGEGRGALFKIGNRSIHQFWHLFSSHFRNVLLAPQRRPDSGRVAWTWRESLEKRPVTATELVELRRRLTEASRSLAGGFGGLDRGDEGPGGSATLEGQVRASVSEMIGQLIDQRDSALSGFVCRTDAGLMVHSWGASAPAQPHYPDAQNGEISGAVVAGHERVAEASVVLENVQGTGVARVKSEQDGSFRFPNVAPGSYRIRVVDRSDFPDAGLTVTMERESITGLELRGTSAESVSTDTNISSPTEDPPPWYKRRWTAIVALLLVVGMGSCIWRSKHPAAGQTVADNRSSGWQSAKGQLAGEEAKNASRDDRKVGTEGAFSSLSSSLPAPKPLTPSSARNQSEKNAAAADHTPSRAEDSDVSGGSVPEGRKPVTDSASEGSSSAATPEQRKPPKSRPPLSTDSRGNPSPSEEHPAGNDEGDEPKSTTGKLAKSSGKTSTEKGAAVLGSSSSTIDVSRDESLSPTGQSPPTDSATSKADGAPGNNSTKAPAAKRPGASGKTSNSPEAGGDAESSAQDSPASSASLASAGQLKPSPARKSGEIAKGANPSAPSGASAEEGASVAEGGTPPESPAADSSTEKNAAKSAPSSKKSSGQKAAQSPAAENPDQAALSTAEKPEATPSPQKRAKQSSGAVGKTSARVKPEGSFPPSAMDNKPEDSAAETSTEITRDASPVVRKKSPEKNSSAASSGTEGEEEATDSSQLPPLPVSEKSGDAPRAMADTPLATVGMIHASLWKPRLVKDLIVPTHPVTAAEEESLETMREKLLRDRAARMPKSFQQLKVKSGLVFEFTVGNEKPLRWRNEHGAEPTGSGVKEHSAQLEWAGAMPLPNASYILSGSDGQRLVQVTSDQTGALILKTAPDIRVSYWVGVELAPIGEAGASAGKPESGFEWRLLSGASIPASWSRDDQWLDGRGRRIAIPLDETTRRVGSYGVALVDPVTGWAIVSDVAAQAR
jgi:Carboxypeptidase regulatory-like domain